MKRVAMVEKMTHKTTKQYAAIGRTCQLTSVEAAEVLTSLTCLSHYGVCYLSCSFSVEKENEIGCIE